MLKQVEIFTRYRQHEKTFSAGYRLTTNNRMELMAAIVALEALKEHCEVVLSTDSQYVRQGITQWIHNWKKRGWKRRDGELKNAEMWQELDGLLQKHRVTAVWVRGHADNEWNNRCDELAVAEREKLA